MALDGQPVLINASVETYARQTFGPERYRIWTMRSAYHNLPFLNGIEQASGAECAARAVSCWLNDDRADLALDLATAYPRQAAVTT